MTEKKYDIGGKIYIQRPLVLGQVRQLLEILKGITIPADADTLGMIEAVGGRLPKALAAILNPEGIPLREKDLDAIAAELEFAITPEQIFEVAEDFFDCNPLQSLLQKLGMAAGTITAQMAQVTALKPFASSLPAGTSPVETQSSGDSLLPSASPGETTDAATSSSGTP